MPFSSERLILRLKPPTNKHVGAAHPKPTPAVCQRSCTPEGSSSPSTRQGAAGAGTRAGRALAQKVIQPPSCPLSTWDHRSPHVDPCVPPAPDFTLRPRTQRRHCGCVCQPGLNTLPFPFPSLRSGLSSQDRLSLVSAFHQDWCHPPAAWKKSWMGWGKAKRHEDESSLLPLTGTGVFTVGMPALGPSFHGDASPQLQAHQMPAHSPSPTVSPSPEELGPAPTYLHQTVSQQPQVPVPHGPGAHQDVGVLAVVPLVIDRQHHPAEGTAGSTVSPHATVSPHPMDPAPQHCGS